MVERYSPKSPSKMCYSDRLKDYDLVVQTIYKYSQGIPHRDYDGATLTAVNRWELYLDIREMKRKLALCEASSETMQQM